MDDDDATQKTHWIAQPLPKLLVLGLLIVALMIPIAQVLGLVRERRAREAGVRREIAGLWGEAQTVVGPALVVPYFLPPGVDVAAPRRTAQAVFLPRELDWTGEATPQVRYRGIFEVPVYEARLRGSGVFARPDLRRWGVADADVLWEQAVVVLGVDDVKGIQEAVTLRWGDAEVAFEPGLEASPFLEQGIHAPLAAAGAVPAGDTPFALELVLHGTSDLKVVPAGEVTTAALASPWPSPGFVGGFLPRERRVSGDGFTARWRVPSFARGFPQAWRKGAVEAKALRDGMVKSAFGVALTLPADGYQKTERSAKYAALFIVLTFGTYFLLELVGPARLHPMQYLLVGFALCLFYLLLLSFTEHFGFAPSYLAASAATVTLVSLYSWSVLASGRRALVLFAALAGLYGYLYTLLEEATRSLLMGSVGLFVALAVLMFLTRRLDWYSLRFQAAGR